MAATAPKLEDLQDKDTADAQAKEQKAVEAAVTPTERELTARDRATHKAREAEEKRQQAIVDAVAEANDKELAELGGPIQNPGNPGHDPKTGKEL